MPILSEKSKHFQPIQKKTKNSVITIHTITVKVINDTKKKLNKNENNRYTEQ